MNAIHLRGRVELAAAAAGSDTRRAQSRAERCARQLLGEGRPDAAGWGHLLRAAIADQRGDSTAALRELEQAIAGLDAARFRLFAAAARRRLARRVPEQEATRLLVETDAVYAAEGVRVPERFTATLAPGFREQ
jgi:hypothetical protein